MEESKPTKTRKFQPVVIPPEELPLELPIYVTYATTMESRRNSSIAADMEAFIRKKRNDKQ